jgi:Flp pilus assembly protein TadD
MASLNRAALLKQAHKCLRVGALVQARGICEDLLRENKKDADALEIQAHIAVMMGRNDEAVALLKKCIAIQPKFVRFHNTLGDFLSTAMGRHDDAVSAYNQAFKVQPNDTRTRAGLIEALEKQGDLDRATQILEPVLQTCPRDPVLGHAYAVVAMADDRPQDAVDMLLKNGAAGPISRTSIYLLGKAYEKLKDFDRAFEMYAQANSLEEHTFNVEEFEQRIEGLMNYFTRQRLSGLPRATTDSRPFVFVTGRPRSGTTLVSKIIAAHPAAVDVGEITTLNSVFDECAFAIGSLSPFPQCLNDASSDDLDQLSRIYLDDIAKLAGPRAQRVIDKSLLNYLHLGLAELLLPKARVIVCTRDAVDNCLACYTEQLVGPHTYANDLRSLGLTHRLFERLVRHWIAELDIPIMEVRYEDVVDDQQGVSRRMIEFLGLPWNDACLKFYEAEKKSKPRVAAPTLSYNQVRQPIYRTSLGRAKNFEKHLGPLFEALDEGERRRSASK